MRRQVIGAGRAKAFGRRSDAGPLTILRPAEGTVPPHDRSYARLRRRPRRTAAAAAAAITRRIATIRR